MMLMFFKIGVKLGILNKKKPPQLRWFLSKNLFKLIQENRNLNNEFYFNKEIKKKFKYPKGYNSSQVETLTNEIKLLKERFFISFNCLKI